MNGKKFSIILLIILIIIGAALLVVILSDKKDTKESVKKEKEIVVNQAANQIVNQPVNQLADAPSDCSVKIEKRTVQGNSLSPLIKDGEIVKVFLGYYNCHQVQRNDVVLYSYAGDKNHLIKMVKGIPNDKFQLQKTTGGWHILINGETLKNSENQPYLLNEKGYKMLSLYERDYKGIIPENAYLILGNLVSGTLDSTHFGLIDKSDILGKVELP